MDSANWPASHMNIAEVFIESGWDSTNINLKDLSTILSIWSRCRQVPDYIIDKARPLRDSRNKITHFSEVQTETAKERIFKEIDTIINEPAISHTISDLRAVLGVLKDLKDNKLHSVENDISNIYMYLKGIVWILIALLVAVLAVFVHNIRTLEPRCFEATSISANRL